MSTDPNQPTAPAQPAPGQPAPPQPAPGQSAAPTTPAPGQPAPGQSAPGQAPQTGSLPQPDPAAGTAANQEAGTARQDAQRALSDGTMNLRGLFDQGIQPGPVGHMNIKAALVALPHIDEVRATQILTATGVDPNHNIDQLGTQQQEALIAAVEQFQ